MSIQFAHLDRAILRTSAARASDARPLYAPVERAHIAALLRSAVGAGRVSPRALRRALALGVQGADGRVRRLGATESDKLRRMLVRPALPRNLATPHDPHYESPAARAALREWAESAIQHGLLPVKGLQPALTKGGRGVASAIDNACKARMGEIYETLPVGCARIAKRARKHRAWEVRPSCLYAWREPDVTVAVFPGSAAGADGFGACWLKFDTTHPDCVPLCTVLANFRTRAISLLAPQDLLDSGFGFGGQIVDDIAAYLDTAVRPDGSIFVPDELKAHLAAEYGWEDAEHDGEVSKCLWYLAKGKSQFSERGDAGSAIAALRHHAHNGENAEASTILLSIADLAEWHGRTIQANPVNLAVDPLDEEGYASGLHIIAAELSGLDYNILNDLYEAQMQVGSEGGVEVRGDDAWKTFDVCAHEACAITALTHLLNDYNEAIA